MLPARHATHPQALEAAIELGLPRVEAGAQGEHKISRGYSPSTTYSSHYIADPTFRSAVGHFLDRENLDIEYRHAALMLLTFRTVSDLVYGATLRCFAWKNGATWTVKVTPYHGSPC